MAGYIKVAQNESAEPVELPLENDGTLLVSTLTALFPGKDDFRRKIIVFNRRFVTLILFQVQVG